MTEHRFNHFRFVATENDFFPGTGNTRFLFNNPEYIYLQKINSFDQFVILNEKHNEIEGIILFERKENSAVSLRKATFGSLELNARIHYDILLEFFTFIGNYYRDSSVKSVIIKHYADLYDPANGPVISLSLSHAGFRVTCHDINHHLPLTENLFQDGINKMENRKLRKCIDAGLQIKSGTDEEITDIYREMITYRNRNKIPVSIDAVELLESFRKFPGNYFLLYVTNTGKEILAGTILVKIAERIMYYFSPATNPAYSRISPMVYLLNGIYGFAKSKECRFVDLGVSSVNNRPQKGLIRFKDHIGGITSSRFTFQLDL